MTGALPDSEPTTGAISIGPVRLAPGLTIRELGWDSNVFDEAGRIPRTTTSCRAARHLGVRAAALRQALRLRRRRSAATTRTTQRERSTGYLLRGRADILLSRVRPFVAGGQTKMRTRPNGEIDVRADRKETEVVRRPRVRRLALRADLRREPSLLDRVRGRVRRQRRAGPGAQSRQL